MNLKHIPTFEEFLNEQELNESKQIGYWYDNGTHQKDYDMYWNKYISKDGTSKNEYAALLHCISSLAGDHYNNGWGMNDYSHEVKELVKNKNLILPFLKDKKAIDTISHLWTNQYNDGGSFIPMPPSEVKKIETAMEDIIDAIILLMKSKNL